MITENDIREELRRKMSSNILKIVIEFANNFLNTFNGILSKEELLNRINSLNYIGFERKQLGEDCGEADGKFYGQAKRVVISSKHLNSTYNEIKSILYHELIHAASYHKERNLDSFEKNDEIYRTGLTRGKLLFDVNNHRNFFDEGVWLEEIMTEYYTSQMLKNEKIDYSGEYVIGSCGNFVEYQIVEYHGHGYINIAALGEIYDYIFGKAMMKAKFVDGNELRESFNRTFKNTSIFDNQQGILPFSQFAADKDVMGRYITACMMFGFLLKNKYKKSKKTMSIDDLVNNPEIDGFLRMLVKIKDETNNSIRIDNGLYALVKGIQLDIIKELCNKNVENENSEDKDIQLSIFMLIDQLAKNGEKIDYNDITYKIFHDNHFTGIILFLNDKKIVFDYEEMRQNFQYQYFQKFVDFGYSNEEIEALSKEFDIDVSNAEFVTIERIRGRATYIYKDEKLYNNHGDIVETSEIRNLFSNVDLELKSK